MKVGQLSLVYFILLVGPLLPVILLYQFFGSSNYFELHGLEKGLVASGPIAAYLVMFVYGFRYFRQLHFLTTRHEIPSGLVGSWRFSSTTAKSTATNRGEFLATEHNGELYMSGSFIAEDGSERGIVSSDACFVDAPRHLLIVVYKVITTSSRIGERQHRAICYLSANRDFSAMEGTWLHIGQEARMGHVAIEKIQDAKT
jgi:hypothetical protein